MHQPVLLTCVLVVTFALYGLCRVRLRIFEFVFHRTTWFIADFTVKCVQTILKAHEYGIVTVPGPFLLRYTDLPLKWHGLQGKRTKYIHGLHETYGI